MKSEERKIGDTFDHQGTLLTVVEDLDPEADNCEKCFFHTVENCRDYPCIIENRTDGKDVHFEKA